LLIGVFGGGQLGRMLALAGYPLGLRFRFLDPAANAPVDGLGERVRGDYDDPAALAAFATGLDCATYEFENVPVAAVAALAARGVRVFPAVRALEVAQDRLAEKLFLQQLGVATAAFAAAERAEDVDAAAAAVGLPAVLKTRRLGYDGKGQLLVRERTELAHAWAKLGGSPLVAEAFVPFDRELAVVAARGADGAVACYPLVETRQRDGVLRAALAPAPGLAPALQAAAEAIATRVLTALDYRGVLAVELFARGDELLVNELAPRVHNSGHWTIEGAETSQFEQHLRAGLGLPLGSTAALGCSATVNLLGSVPALATLLAAAPRAHVHLYGKEERPGRKLGHVTLRARDHATLSARLAAFGAATGIELDLSEPAPASPDVPRGR
jgi:5-(carboxyamino)imidazole ribonucleotide synthase